MTVRHIPEGFLWGASTAAYQVEGGIDNVDWAKGAREGKVPPAGRACDHYHRYEQDFDIAAKLGMNAQRLSIEWARIEPEEGKWNDEAIEHYRQVLLALKARGLKPVVNLWHFTLPLWFSERGGFLSDNAADVFARYCAFVIERLGEHTDTWLTINEPEIWAQHGYWKRDWPPFSRDALLYVRARRELAVAHRAAYRAMKQVRPDIKVGIAKHNIFFETNWNPINVLKLRFIDWFWNHSFLRTIRGTYDFIGLNHYLHHTFGMTKRERDAAVYSDMGWEVHPTSLYHCIAGLTRYGVPIFVSEHGIADAEDTRRPQFIQNAYACVRRALAEGMPLVGYFYWSLLDNYEWAHGYTKRFGLVEVNYDTLERIPRPSTELYARVCRGEELS